EAVPHGQFEAARSAGLGELQILRYVIMPQAVRICFPALGNNLVSLVKNSSLVSTIGMVELMFVANDISFNNFRTFEIYGTAGGVALGLLRFAPWRGVGAVVAWLVELVRAVPLLLLLFFIFFGLPALAIRIPTFPAAVLAMSLWMAVNTAEVVRGGIQSIP